MGKPRTPSGSTSNNSERQAMTRSGFSPLFILLTLVFFCPASTVAAEEKPELVLQTGHASRVECLSFSPDGRLLASGSADATIRLWDTGTGHELRVLTGQGAGVTAVGFSPDGRWLASGGLDGAVIVWEVSTGRETMRIPAHKLSIRAVAFSPDGQALASASADSSIRLWDFRNQRELKKLTGHSGWVTAISFSPDGHLLASGSDDQTIRLWDVRRGNEILPQPLTGHTGRVTTLAFSQQGRSLVSGSADQTVRIWRISSGARIRTIDHSSAVLQIAPEDDGRTLLTVCAGKSVGRYDTASGKLLDVIATGEAGRYEVVVFSPDRSRLAVSSGSRTIRLLHLNGSDSRLLASQTSAINAVAFSADGRWMATGSQDYQVRVWDMVSGRKLYTLAGGAGTVNTVAFSDDGRLLAAGSVGGAVRLWKTMTGRELRTWNAHPAGPGSPTASANAVVFSPDASRLISAGNDQTVRVWDLDTGAGVLTLHGHLGEVQTIALHPDGRLLVSGGADKTIRVWDLATGNQNQLIKGHTAEIATLAFSPDGRRLASGSRDRTIRVWNFPAGELIRTLPEKRGQVSAVAFSSDGRHLAAGNQSGELKLFEPETGREMKTLTGHPAGVNSLAFTAGGGFLISGSDDGSARLWEVTTGSPQAVLVAVRESSDWLVATPDGLFDGSPAAWGQILWRFGQRTLDVRPVEVFFNEFYSPDILAAILAGRKPQTVQDIGRRDRRQPVVALKVADRTEGNEAGLKRRRIRVQVEITEAPPDQEHAEGSGARDLRLFRNGLLVEAWRGDLMTGKSGKKTVETEIPIVAGENRLTAYAFNRENVKSQDYTLKVSGAAELRHRGTLFLTAVGINQYANPQFNLRYAAPDARSFLEELQRQQSGLGNYERIEVVQLTDQQATKSRILSVFRHLSGETVAGDEVFGNLRKAEPEDAVVFYFAGHGAAVDEQFYLIPHDPGYAGNRTDLTEAAFRRLLNFQISDRELEQAFEKIDAGHLLMIIDACESGQALEAEDRRQGPMNSRGLAQLAYEKGIYILTAAQGYQAAMETARLGHGYLTYALVEEALKSTAALTGQTGEALTARSWLDYATERVPEMQQEKRDQERLLTQREKKSGGAAKPEKK